MLCEYCIKIYAIANTRIRLKGRRKRWLGRKLLPPNAIIISKMKLLASWFVISRSEVRSLWLALPYSPGNQSLSQHPDAIWFVACLHNLKLYIASDEHNLSTVRVGMPLMASRDPSSPQRSHRRINQLSSMRYLPGIKAQSGGSFRGLKISPPGCINRGQLGDERRNL
jgi:hypothetical protein